MENNKNVKKGKRLVETVGQAKTLLGILLQEEERLRLERGRTVLLDRVRNPKLDILLDS